MNFGVFFTCYKERDAVEFSIATLRKVYPKCPIYLVSDGGLDFSFLKEQYDLIETKLEEDTRGISQGRISREEWQTNEVREKIYNSIKAFFKRNLDAIHYCNTENILIMEPDVLVRGPLKHFPSKTCGLLGSRVNHPTYQEYLQMQEILKAIPGSVSATHFGSTPAFYHADAMRKVNDFFYNNTDVVKRFIETDQAFVCYDIFLTMLFACCGYEEVFNPDIIECFRDSSWESKENPLVHQFRQFYPSKESGYDGRHA